MPHFQTTETTNVLAIIQAVRENLDRIEAILAPANPDNKYDLARLDPPSPLNKSGKFLTVRGIEVCYRLFDLGKTRYEVAQLMGISFGASTHRFKTWEQLGGKMRSIQPIDDEPTG